MSNTEGKPCIHENFYWVASVFSTRFGVCTLNFQKTELVYKENPEECNKKMEANKTVFNKKLSQENFNHQNDAIFKCPLNVCC